jgi:uncharacterized YccA/Bax inhibitor family protein
MRTSNPVLRPNTFSTFDEVDKKDQTMSIEGTVYKIFILLAVLVIAAIPTWKIGASTHPEIVLMTTSAMLTGIFGGLIVALVIIFKKSWAPIIAPVYALFEGVVLGGISAQAEVEFSGRQFF